MGPNHKSFLFLALAGLALGACNNGSTETGLTDTGDTGMCDVEIDSTVPENGSADAYYRADVEFEISDPDPEMDPTVALATSDGTTVAGTTSYSEDMETVYFTPDEPLDPETDYDATLTYCRGDSTISFTTSELGKEPEVELEGKTYVLDLASARITQPAALAGLLEQYEDELPTILIGILAVGTDTIDIIGAMADEDSDDIVQDYCEPTIGFPEGADFSESPYFQVGPADIPFDIDSETSITIYSLLVAGTFAADGSYFGGGELEGEADARDVAAAFPEAGTADEICKLTESFQAPCEACSSDGEEYCLYVTADQIEAEEVEDLTLEVVDEADTHELCDE